jgi:DHA2 family methylenomycin A resistance protein-like MFS transporter
MVYLDTTIVNVALPAVRIDLGTQLTSLQWVIDAYVLAFACLLLSAGTLGDIVGRKQVFIVGLLGFVVASMVCAVAPDIRVLIAGRFLQGVFASAMIPVSLAIIVGLFTDTGARAWALSLWTSLGGLALVAGPVVGGFMIDTWGWRSVFWINVPVGLVAIVALARLLPCPQVSRIRRLDVPGQILFIIGLAALTVMAIEGNRWSSSMILGALAVALVSLSCFAIREARTADPMLPLDLFSNGVLLTACAVNFSNFFAFFSLIFTLTLYLQDVERLSAFDSGLHFLVLTLPIMVASYVASAVTSKVGSKIPITLGAVATTTGLVIFAHMPLNNGFWSMDGPWP